MERLHHRILQLADISRPVKLLQQPQKLWGEGPYRVSILTIEIVQKRLAEQRDISLSVAQRRDLKLEHIDPVKQVFAEVPLVYLL